MPKISQVSHPLSDHSKLKSLECQDIIRKREIGKLSYQHHPLANSNNFDEDFCQTPQQNQFSTNSDDPILMATPVKTTIIQLNALKTTNFRPARMSFDHNEDAFLGKYQHSMLEKPKLHNLLPSKRYKSPRFDQEKTPGSWHSSDDSSHLPDELMDEENLIQSSSDDNDLSSLSLLE